MRWTPSERHEERIALRVDLYTAVTSERVPQQAPVLGEHVGVIIAELLQQARRPFDVAEQKCDSAGREVLSHDSIIRAGVSSVHSAPGPEKTIRALGERPLL
jgi:hypothetical protein